MRAGCRLPRSVLFRLNLNLNLQTRCRSPGRADRSCEGLGAETAAGPMHPSGLGGPRAPTGFVPCPGGRCGNCSFGSGLTAVPEGLAFFLAKCWKVPSQQRVCHPSFHGSFCHEVISASKSQCTLYFVKGKK